MFPVVTEDIYKCLKITQDCSNVVFFKNAITAESCVDLLKQVLKFPRLSKTVYSTECICSIGSVSVCVFSTGTFPSSLIYFLFIFMSGITITFFHTK